MEKKCEFCASLSPIVCCKADAAHLCLSCDARVHSANALSYRHPRTLICQSCRYQPASVRCLDHEMFMCQSCDTSNHHHHHHHVSFQHHKRVIGSYVGCPSAKDLAALWGFDSNELENNIFEFEEGTSSRGTKVLKDDNWQHSNYLILQQIHDLERLQLSEGIFDNSHLEHFKGQTGGLPFKHYTMCRFHTNLNNCTENFGSDLDSSGSLDDKSVEPLSSPFSQLDNFTSTVINPLQGDSFWQYKSPTHNSEIWLQNMQDLGVCDEVRCFDAVDIPDVDLTFRNFEELFGNEHELSRVVDENMACSFADKHTSFGKLDRGNASTIEHTPWPSPVCLNAADREIDTSDQFHHLESNNYRPRPIWPSYSVSSSFSVSRITRGSEYKDDGLSPSFPEQIVSQGSCDYENTKLEAKENVIMRYKEKKVLRHEKQGQYTSPKSNSGGKKQGKSRVMKVESRENETECNAKVLKVHSLDV